MKNFMHKWRLKRGLFWNGCNPDVPRTLTESLAFVAGMIAVYSIAAYIDQDSIRAASTRAEKAEKSAEIAERSIAHCLNGKPVALGDKAIVTCSVTEIIGGA